MSCIASFCYDRFMKKTEQACLIDWRRELLQDVKGRVLEIGAGTGASLELYPQIPDLEIVMSEPDKNMRAQLVKKLKRKGQQHVAVIESSAEKISSSNQAFDFAFISLVCCSVKDPAAALHEIKRVLKPDGRLIFLEHVAADHGTKRRRWQNRLNPVWRFLAGNCHLNRDTELTLNEVGFIITSIQRESMRKAWSLVRPTIRGVATLR